METAIICLVTFLASGLTLFSGFGLGTMLLPLFALFFPIQLAIALTAVVHVLNNLFKLALLGRHANHQLIVRFGVPAFVSAMLGAWLLGALAALPPLATYHGWGTERAVMPVKVVVAVLMVGFALMDILPAFERVTVSPRFLPVGGALSGFFGGLSGHQGALRSAFLIKCGLPKEQFIATGVVIACLVDGSRLSVYASQVSSLGLIARGPFLAAVTVSAWVGAWIGARFIKQVTIRAIQVLVSILLFGIAVGLGSGML